MLFTTVGEVLTKVFDGQVAYFGNYGVPGTTTAPVITPIVEQNSVVRVVKRPARDIPDLEIRLRSRRPTRQRFVWIETAPGTGRYATEDDAIMDTAIDR